MIALYVRVSSKEQAEDGYSVGEQTERLKKYAEAMGWKMTRVYTDAGFSGSGLDRPAIRQLISDIKDGMISRVVSWKLDRLSRSQKDTLYLIEDVFLPNGCDYVSMTENFDTSTPFGRAMLGILAVFAQLERERIKERVAIGKDGRAKDGRWHGGGLVPIGYDIKNTDLVPNPVEAPQVREAFSLYCQGLGFNRIAEVFEDRGYRHKYGRWTESTVRAVIANRTYLGLIKWMGDEYQGIHEPLISEDVFRTASSIRESRQSVRGPQNRSLLAGVIWCRRCGARYFVTDHGKRRVYACHSRCKRNRSMIKDPNCLNDYIPEEELDQIVLGQIRQLVIDPDAIPRPDEPPESGRDALLKEKEALTAKRSRLLDLYATGLFDLEELSQKIAPITRRLEGIRATLDAPEPSQEARKAILSFGEYIDTGTKEEARLLVLSLIQRIEIDGQDVFIRWKFG